MIATFEKEIVKEKEEVKKSVGISCINKGDSYILKISSEKNELGILYRVSAVLFVYGWEVQEAIAETIHGEYIKDAFIIKNNRGERMTDLGLSRIQHDLNQLLFYDLSVWDYLKIFNMHFFMEKSNFALGNVSIFNPKSLDSTVLDIKTSYRPSLLFEVSQLLFALNIDILSMTGKTEGDKIRQSYLLRTEAGDKLSDDLSEKIKSTLLSLSFS